MNRTYKHLRQKLFTPNFPLPLKIIAGYFPDADVKLTNKFIIWNIGNKFIAQIQGAH